MKNQDPTEPKDTSQYLSQLASFSAVEQGVNTNKKLDSLMTAMQLAQADSLIGHTLTGSDGFLLGTIKSVEIGQNGLNGHSRKWQAVSSWMPGVTIG